MKDDASRRTYNVDMLRSGTLVWFQNESKSGRAKRYSPVRLCYIPASGENVAAHNHQKTFNNDMHSGAVSWHG